jgi:hypothetical protein
MVQIDLAITMVSGVLITMVIFLFILFKIFGKKKKNRPMMTLLPGINRKETYESQPEKFVIRSKDVEILEKEFHPARDIQKTDSVEEIIMEKKDEPKKEKEGTINEEQVPQHVMQSIEDNNKLKLEDFLIDIQDENIKKKAKKNISSTKNREKSDMLKEKVLPEKKALKKQSGKKNR